MRKFCMLFAIVAVVSAVRLSSASAAEPKQQNSEAQQATKDPNYRYFNGQWWYWLPQQKSWKVWNGTQWNDYQPQETRTFSYDQEQSGLTENVGEGVTRLFGAPLRTVPENVGQTNQIIGSFGFRRAGSKMIGNY